MRSSQPNHLKRKTYMPSEIIEKKKIQIRRGLKDLREDLGLLRDGVLDFSSFRSGYTPVSNPVQVEVRSADGKLKSMRYTHNIRTNDGIDWQARMMGGGQATANFPPAYVQTAAALIAITAPTGTAAGQIVDTNTRVAASIVQNQFVGCTLVYFDTTVKVAHIVGNSAAGTNTITWYFDNWYSPDAPGASVVAPAANKAYHVLAAGPAYYVGLSTAPVGTKAATDHTIEAVVTGATSEIGSGFASAPVANGLGRTYAQGSATAWNHTLGTNTYALKNTFTATGVFTGVASCGMFTASICPGDAAADLTNVGRGGGVMVFENDFSSVNMASSDTLTITWTVTF